MLGNEKISTSAIVNLYVDADNNIKVSTRNIGDVLSNIFEYNITLKPNKWYYTAMNRELNLVSSYTNGSEKIQYSYDALKNIKSIVENGKTTSFTYNELNELVREDNGTLNKTITYEYDAGGNILSKKEYAYTTGTLGTAAKTIKYSYK